MMTHSFRPLIGLALAAALAPAAAQTPQKVSPPQAQVWIDVATFGGLGMPGMDGSGGGANPLNMLGGLLGIGKGAQNSFGRTQGLSSGRFVDITLMSRANPALAQAQQNVPATFLSPALQLVAPQEQKSAPVDPTDEQVEEKTYDKPKGKLYLYWGCGEQVGAGQPRVLDMASLSAADAAKFFVVRRATQRGTHASAGRPVWPNATDTRMVPEQASLVGEHLIAGDSVPPDFRFQIPPMQDLMPAIALQQQDRGGATALNWAPLPTARGYFISALGARGENEIVIWTSSEQPETGFGLVDYQTNAAVDRWVREKVLMAPNQTSCAVPKGVFSQEGGPAAAMLRAIAYGSELNLAQPPRPADPRQPWAPVWAAKIRVKSVTTAMLGMQDMGDMMRRGMSGNDGSGNPPSQAPAQEPRMPGVGDLLKGIFSR